MSLSPPTNPLHAVSVTETVLAHSGLKLVLAERGQRQTLQIDDEQGQLVSVVSDSLLDPTVLRGAWHGVRNGQPWALVVGRGLAGPVSVSFSSRKLHLPGHKPQAIVLEPQWIGDFWVAEAAVEATRATVTVAGVAAGTSSLANLS